MGKRGHGGKKKNKKNKSGNENKENALEKKTTPLNDKLILDKGYKGDLRSVTVKHVHQDVTLEDIAKHIEYTDGKQYKMLAVERLKKKQTAEDDNKSVQFLPSRTCKLTFKGKTVFKWLLLIKILYIYSSTSTPTYFPLFNIFVP